jgi:hypothetical protein
MGTSEGRVSLSTVRHGDHLPSAAALFGRDVVDAGGQHLGRVELVVRLPDGERQAVVRTGFLRRRRCFVPLSGAAFVGGRIVVSSRPAPILQLHPTPGSSEGNPHCAA